MAEQEVIKHTKRVYKVWNSKEHSLWQKVKEFVLEIIIIVFAVSLSIWFHNRSEHAHQQEETKEFLSGLRADLLSDIHEMTNDKDSYLNQQRAFRYIAGIKLNQLVDFDSLKTHKRWIFVSTMLNINSGRFEGFKSSGKIGTIEDKQLQNDIMDLYQENLPVLKMSTDWYISAKLKLFDYFQKNEKRITDSTTNFSNIIVADEAHAICKWLAITPKEIIQRYDDCITKMNTVLAEIDQNTNEK